MIFVVESLERSKKPERVFIYYLHPEFCGMALVLTTDNLKFRGRDKLIYLSSGFFYQMRTPGAIKSEQYHIYLLRARDNTTKSEAVNCALIISPVTIDCLSSVIAHWRFSVV
ncbi:hypothetical protein KQX54_013413 [Cotesia glomerata]|uniref:Uncharacterized protein n=1 Tax=Cotesia glomerata TaxID=32391 RepID=A0AAV7J143_COTGL|nr:hypothetical protein KQX54_013413 [Cotesia glomerata]